MPLNNTVLAAVGAVAVTAAAYVALGIASDPPPAPAPPAAVEVTALDHALNACATYFEYGTPPAGVILTLDRAIAEAREGAKGDPQVSALVDLLLVVRTEAEMRADGTITLDAADAGATARVNIIEGCSTLPGA